MKNSISYFCKLRLTILQYKSLTFLPVIVVVVLRIKTIEQNIALKQLKCTPRSMAVQLLLDVKLNLFSIPLRKIVRCLKSLEKIGFILCTRVWNHETHIKLYCRLNHYKRVHCICALFAISDDIFCAHFVISFAHFFHTPIRGS